MKQINVTINFFLYIKMKEIFCNGEIWIIINVLPNFLFIKPDEFARTKNLHFPLPVKFFEK